MSVTEARVRELLLQVWGEQTCQVRPDEWPKVLARLMEKVPGERGRGSYKPFIDDAVPVLAALVNSEAPITAEAVWRSFSRIDHEHRDKLAQLLEGERGSCQPSLISAS